MRLGCLCQRTAGAATAASCAFQTRHLSLSSSRIARQANGSVPNGDDGFGSSSDRSPSTPAPEHSRRRETEADRLARDITTLGKQRWEAKTKAKLHVSAERLPDAASARPVKGSSSSPLGLAGTGKQRGDAAKVAYQLSKVRPARHAATEQAAPAAAPWVSPYHRLPPRQPDGSLSADIMPSVTDIAYTLDEVEQSLFSQQDVDQSDTADTEKATPVAGSASAAEEEFHSPGSRVVTADDACLRATTDVLDPVIPPPLFASTQQKRMTPEAGRAEEQESQPPKAGSETSQTTAKRVKTVDVANSTAEAVSPPTAQPFWVNDHIPCSFRLSSKESSRHSQQSRKKDDHCTLLSVRFDPSSSSYVVAPKAPIPTTQDLITSLNGALSWLEMRHAEDERRQPKCSGSKAAATRRATSVMLHFSNATLAGWKETPSRKGASVDLQPTESELSLSSLQRRHLSTEKERLLHRLRTAAALGLRVTAVVGQHTFVADFVAELLFCCHDCYMVGSAEEMTVGFPSVEYGVLPSPTTLTVLRRRVEHVMGNDLAKNTLFAQLRTVGTTGGLEKVVAPSPEEVTAALVPRLHTAAAALWADLGLLDASVPVRTTVSTAWRQFSIDRLRHFFRTRKEARRAPRGTSPFSSSAATSSTSHPLAAPSSHALWAQYCKEATHVGDGTSWRWRELMMAVLDTQDCYYTAAMYQHARATVDTATFDHPHKFVYLNAENSPETLSASELQQTIASDDPAARIALVLDSSIPLKKKEHLLASLQTSRGAVQNRTDLNGFDVILVGDPSTLSTCTSLLPLVAVLAPVGRATSEPLPLLPKSLPRALEPSRMYNGLVEVALLPVQARGRGRDSSASIPDSALVHAQSAAVLFLGMTKRPFILSSSGEEGVRMVAGLALDLCRLTREAPTLSVGAVLASLERRLSFTTPIATTIGTHGVDCIHRHISNLVREEEVGMGHSSSAKADVSYDDVTRLFHKLSVAREDLPIRGEAAPPSSPLLVPPAVSGPLGSGLGITATASQRLFLSLVDRCAAALLRGTLCNAADVNLLSVAALAVAPSTGGVLASVDHHIHRDDWSLLLMEMELCTAQTNHKFAAIPLLRWMSTHALLFAELDAPALEKARAALLNMAR